MYRCEMNLTILDWQSLFVGEDAVVLSMRNEPNDIGLIGKYYELLLQLIAGTKKSNPLIVFLLFCAFAFAFQKCDWVVLLGKEIPLISALHLDLGTYLTLSIALS